MNPTADQFDRLTPEQQARFWRGVKGESESAIEAVLADPATADPPRSQPPRRRPVTFTLIDSDDPLRAIEPPLYVEALTGVEVPENGRLIRCPLPRHDDRTPSFKAYPTPERGFYCFGCHAGGGIIDFGAALYGIEPRGSGYREIRERLEADLRLALRSAA